MDSKGGGPREASSENHRRFEPEGAASEKRPRPSVFVPHWLLPAYRCCWSISIPRPMQPPAWAVIPSEIPNVYHLMNGEADLDEVLRKTELPTLQLIGASPDLAGAEIEMAELEDRHHLLRDALQPARGTVRVHFHRLSPPLCLC